MEWKKEKWKLEFLRNQICSDSGGTSPSFDTKNTSLTLLTFLFGRYEDEVFDIIQPAFKQLPCLWGLQVWIECG